MPKFLEKFFTMHKSDILLFLGMGLLFYGIWQLSPPWAFIITGGEFIAISALREAFLPKQDGE